MMKRMILLVFALSTLTVAWSQTKTVQGTVTESPTGEPAIGVNIIVKGTTIGTVTSMDGDYSLANVPANAVLVFSRIGMKSEEVRVGNQTVINVTLSENSQQLDEIVVVGYGVQRKSDLTGAVGSVKSADLVKISTPNVANALQGRVSGVMVSALGEPGKAPEVRIRGIGTVNNSNPLYVVDGMLMDDINFLNAHDISSMEVLKDASATAIYGSRGANGVIIVTTKQGTKGKARVTVTASEGLQFANTGKFKMLGASDYAMLQNEAFKSTKPNDPALYPDPSVYGAGTNWFNEIMRTASVRDYQLSVAGGSDAMTYNLSAGYFQQDGIINKGKYNRFTIRANNTYKPYSFMTLGHNLSASFSKTSDMNPGVVASAYRISPIIKPFNEDGTFADSKVGSTGNPLASLEYTNNDNWNDRLVGNGFMNLEFIKGLNFKTSIGIDLLGTREQNFSPKFYVSETQKNTENSLDKKWKRDFTWLWENILTYDLNINTDHRLNFLAGYTVQRREFELLGGSGRNFYSDNEDYWYIDRAQEDTKKIENNAWSESMMSGLFRANYALKDRYLLTASMRADGSSKFGPNKRWGYFPSVAAGWRVTEEAFIKESAAANWLSNLKVRASWGQIGNDKIDRYQYYALADVNSSFDAIFNGVYFPGGTITKLYNKDIHWEVSEQLDLGFDLGLFKNKLTVEFDYYQRDTKDMLVTVDVPSAVGLTAVASNVGSVRNSGLDFTIRHENKIDEVSYSVRLVGTTIRNEVTNLGGKTITAGDIGAGKLTQQSKVGEPIRYFYGYNTVGIFQNQAEIDAYNAKAAEISGKPNQKYQSNVAPGDLIYADTDGNGFVDAQDRSNIGSQIPAFIGGLGLTVAWRGFDFSADFQGNFGNKIYNAKQAERYAGADNWDTSFLDRWTKEGQVTNIPRMTYDGNNYFVSTRFLESGNYVKLQNIELGYTLPQSIINKAFIQNVRVYISGNNLLYFTKYNGFTPEISGGLDRTVYPVTASCRLGLNVTF